MVEIHSGSNIGKCRFLKCYDMEVYMKSKSIKKYLLHPSGIIPILSYKGFLRWIPDKVYLKFIFHVIMKKKLNLENPKTYSEKLQWIKLYDRNPLYVRLVDKFEVKKYIQEIIGQDYVIPTLGIWENVEDIPFAQLPSRFVLKCTHDSGGIVICKDKDNLDIVETKKILNKHLHKNFYWYGREWPYKQVKPRIICEEYMEDARTQELRDYKFFAFNGIVKAVFIATGRQDPNDETRFDFFDDEFNHLDIVNGHPQANSAPEKPVCFEEMKSLASKLSKGIPQVRVDFYEVNGKVFFGEMTFFHWSGLKPFEPEKWDEVFGSWIVLPNKVVSQ